MDAGTEEAEMSKVLAARRGRSARNFFHRGPRKSRSFCGERRKKRNGVKPARRAGFTECSFFRRRRGRVTTLTLPHFAVIMAFRHSGGDGPPCVIYIHLSPSAAPAAVCLAAASAAKPPAEVKGRITAFSRRNSGTGRRRGCSSRRSGCRSCCYPDPAAGFPAAGPAPPWEPRPR